MVFKTIEIKQVNELYEISFPYNIDLIGLVKNVPGRAWVPERKVWTIPKAHLGMFFNQIKGTPYEEWLNIDSEEHLFQNETLDKTEKIPDIDISDVDFKVAEDCKPYNHQLDFMKYAIDRQNHKLMSGFLLCDEQGAGKALTLDTKIYTPTGYKLMKDIEVGDEVFDESGKICHVIATYNHDNLNMYKVSFSDNTSVMCCEDHLWTFYVQGHELKTWSVKQIISGSKYGAKYDDWKHRVRKYYLPKIQPVQFNNQEVFIHPYVLGVLIAEGSLSCINGTVTFTSGCTDIVQNVKDLLPKGYTLNSYCGVHKNTHRIVLSNNSGRNCHIKCIETGKEFNSQEEFKSYYNVSRTISYLPIDNGYYYYQKLNLHFELNKTKRNEVASYIKKLGLDCTAHYKFIPDIYKYNSVENRWSLLQGLMDTDGYASSNSNSHTYSTTSKQLAYDVVWLVESLGGYCSVTESNSKLNGKDYGLVYDVVIKMDNPKELYKASVDKKQKASPRKFKPRKNFQNIEYIGKMPGKCITVDSPNKLYLCEHFIPTHNTLEIFNLAIYNKEHFNFKHCLIICCMNTSKFHWVDDIKRHTDLDAYILGTRKLKKKGTLKYDTGSEAKLQDLQTMKMYGEEDEENLPYFLIVNIEAIRSKIGNSYAISEQITKLIKDGQINMIAIDEIHRNCSPQSIQGKRILDIKKKTGDKCMWMPITGTPIVNKATDVYLPLKLVDGHAYKNYWTWCQEFCIYGGYGGHEIIGYRNMPKLKEMLQKNMIRRLKSDILDLPPKIFYTEYVENTPYQTKLYNKVCDDILSERESIVRSLNPLAKMMKLRQVNGSPELVDDKLFYTDKDYIKHNSKLQRLLELLEEIHEREEKVVIFSNWVEPLRMIYTYISKKYKTTTYVGSLKENIRQQHIEQFKNDPETTILMGTIDALGVTHTLTVANNIIFYDEPWTVASFDQCCDRCHRISTTKPVNIYKLLAKDTIDERVDDLLYNKRRMSTFIVDNIDIHSHPELFDILMGVK